MTSPRQATLLRLYLGESDRHQGGLPLYEALVRKAHEDGMAGATVLRSPMGFGATSRLHTAKILQLSTDLPIVVEIVDSEEKVEAYLTEITPWLQGGLVITQPVAVRHSQAVAKAHDAASAPAANG